MYMNDIKLFVPKEKEMETQIQAMTINSQDLGMEFGIEKCAMLVIKSGKRHMTEAMELQNQEKYKNTREKETHKHLGILEADTVKQVEMKEKMKTSVSGEKKTYSKPNCFGGAL